MKKYILFSMLFTYVIIFSSCNDDNVSSQQSNSMPLSKTKKYYVDNLTTSQISSIDLLSSDYNSLAKLNTMDFMENGKLEIEKHVSDFKDLKQVIEF